MRSPIGFKSEDVLILATVTFALLYPLFIAFLLWHEDYNKKREYMQTLLPLAKVLVGSVDCGKAYSKDILSLLDESIAVKDVVKLCKEVGPSEITRETLDFQREEDKNLITYTVVFRSLQGPGARYLTIKAIDENDKVFVVEVYLDKVKVLP